MKKLKVLSALLVLVLLATPVFAQARYGIKTSQPIESTGIVNDQDGNAISSGTWVYGVEIYADESSSFMGVYNAGTLAVLNAATTYARDEIGEATQYDTATKWYSTPRYFSNGVGVIMSTGVGFINYGSEP